MRKRPAARRATYGVGALDGVGSKLSADEIRSVRAVADQPEATGQQIEEEFRRLVVARVRAYRAGGLAALPPSADHGREGRRPADAFAAILARSPFLNRVPALTTWLAGDPAVADERVESFFYWSKEYYGRGRPVISVTSRTPASISRRARSMHWPRCGRPPNLRASRPRSLPGSMP